MKDEIEPKQVSLTFIHSSHSTVQVVARHTIIGSLQLYAGYQDLQDLELHQLLAEQFGTTLPHTPPSSKCMCSPAEVDTI